MSTAPTASSIAFTFDVGATLRDELEAEATYLRWVLAQAGLPLQVRTATTLRERNVAAMLAAPAEDVGGSVPLVMHNNMECAHAG